MVSCLISSDAVCFVQNVIDWVFGIVRCIVQNMVGLAAGVGRAFMHIPRAIMCIRRSGRNAPKMRLDPMLFRN